MKLDKGRQMESYEKWVEAKEFEAYKESQKEFYSHVSKQFEPQNPKPYQKRKVNGQMTFDDIDDKYHQAIAKEQSYANKYKEHKVKNREWQQKVRTFSEAEIEDIYWEKLVHLGWKFHEEREMKALVIPCQECDEILSWVLYAYIDTQRIENLCKPSLAEKVRAEHKCKAIPEAKPHQKENQ